jgi:hypothetical protein
MATAADHWFTTANESSHPFNPGQDFPLRFAVPGMPAMPIENNEQLQRAYR